MPQQINLVWPYLGIYLPSAIFWPVFLFSTSINRIVIKSNRRERVGIGDFFLPYFSVQNVQNVNVTIQCTLAIYPDNTLSYNSERVIVDRLFHAHVSTISPGTRCFDYSYIHIDHIDWQRWPDLADTHRDLTLRETLPTNSWNCLRSIQLGTILYYLIYPTGQH